MTPDSRPMSSKYTVRWLSHSSRRSSHTSGETLRLTRSTLKFREEMLTTPKRCEMSEQFSTAK